MLVQIEQYRRVLLLAAGMMMAIGCRVTLYNPKPLQYLARMRHMPACRWSLRAMAAWDRGDRPTGQGCGGWELPGVHMALQAPMWAARQTTLEASQASVCPWYALRLGL